MQKLVRNMGMLMVFGEGVPLRVLSFWFADKSGRGTSGKPFLNIRISEAFLPLFNTVTKAGGKYGE